MPNQRLKLGPFEIDPATQVASRDGEPLALGQRSVQVLAALFGRPGEVLTKSELLDAGWGGLAVEESNLSVQVAALRKALGERPDGGEWIITVPRVGYRFVAPGSPATEMTRSMRKAIAVLPFVNLTADPEQDYFADGLAEEIIIALSKVGGLRVTARNSSFAYRGTATDVRVIGTALDVAYVLEGSVRRSANRVRMSVQLADTTTGEQVWAERYDSEMTDLLSVQDAVTRQIVAALQVNLRDDVVLATSDTENLEAFELYLRGRAMMDAPPHTLDSLRRASQLLERVIALDPNFARAHSQLAIALGMIYANHWSGEGDDALHSAIAHAERGLDLAPQSPFAHAVRALIAMHAGDGVRFRAEADAALALNPNDPMGLSMSAGWLTQSGRPLESIPLIERFMRLDPAMNPLHLNQLGSAYLAAGKFETAAALYRERILLVPETDMSRGYLISALGHLGKVEEARTVWDELMRINPAFRLSEWIDRGWLPNSPARGLLLEGYRMAGVPEDKI